jgi:hypothetical protein
MKHGPYDNHTKGHIVPLSEVFRDRAKLCCDYGMTAPAAYSAIKADPVVDIEIRRLFWPEDGDKSWSAEEERECRTIYLCLAAACIEDKYEA